MPESLSNLSGTPLTTKQLQGILNQIDLDIASLLEDGKHATLKYSIGGANGPTIDRASALKTLLEAREHYQQLLNHSPHWSFTSPSTL